MNNRDFVRYQNWSLELWSRNYGTTAQIDRDVSDGKLIPGTMPDELWKPGDAYRKQSEVRELLDGQR